MSEPPSQTIAYREKYGEHPIHRHFLLTETRDHDIVVFQEQYRALRQEILQRQQRRFLIVIGGALGIPGLSGLSLNNIISGDVVLVAPLIIVVISYLFALENYSIARAGTFIEISVENYFKAVPGWEHYLRDLSSFRLKQPPAAKGAQLAFIFLMIAYFFAAYIVGAKQILQHETSVSEVAFLLYSLVTLTLLSFWLCSIRPNLNFSSQLLKLSDGGGVT